MVDLVILSKLDFIAVIGIMYLIGFISGATPTKKEIERKRAQRKG